MTTPAKLYGKDLSEYDDVDVDALLAQLSPEEINILAKEVDPDVSSLMFQSKRYLCNEQCLKKVNYVPCLRFLTKNVKDHKVRVNNREIPTNFDCKQAIT
jgi:tropomodulin